MCGNNKLLGINRKQWLDSHLSPKNLSPSKWINFFTFINTHFTVTIHTELSCNSTLKKNKFMDWYHAPPLYSYWSTYTLQDLVVHKTWWGEKGIQKSSVRALSIKLMYFPIIGDYSIKPVHFVNFCCYLPISLIEYKLVKKVQHSYQAA